MLEQLVESRESFGDGKRRGGFLLTTMVLIVSLFGSGLLWSLFAKDFGIGDESLELSTLVAPVIPAQEEPPAPIERELQPEQNTIRQSELPSRRENILRIDENPIDPKVVSVNPSLSRERPRSDFKIIGAGAESDGSFSGSTGKNGGRGGASDDSGLGKNGIKSPPVEIEENDPPPPLKKTPAPVAQKPPTQHAGVVNGKALVLPKPAYPRTAQQLRLSGDVSVQVTIDESGRVISAKAVSGHPFFRQVSEVAARSAAFRPTLLNNQPVKVTGVIIYKFSAQ